LKKVCDAESCKFFYQRPDSTPIEFEGLFEAAMYFRECRLDNLDDEFAQLWRTLPFWAVQAYKAFERSFRIVEAEQSGKDPNKGANDMSIKPTGSTAFAAIEAAKVARNDSDAETVESIEKVFEANPELSDSIFDFIKTQINAFP
jgi:hypothetical protein